MAAFFDAALTPSGTWPGLFGRPIGRFALSLHGQLARIGAIREHGPDLARARARGLENKMPAVGSPTWALVASGVAREFDQSVRSDIHHVKIVVPVRTAPAKSQQLTVRRPRGVAERSIAGF